MIGFDHSGFDIHSRSAYLVSGEFPYFRVPKDDWRRRMRLFQEVGGNCLSTYIPWLIHEPREGEFRFDDCPSRDLSDFLRAAGDLGLYVLLRPGPYVYTEMVNAGLPVWLLEKYPEIRAVNAHGEVYNPSAVSYLHPVFLSKARRYYRAVAKFIRPFQVQQGGPVAMVQLDNELSGVQIWAGSMDYHPETLGLGSEHGRFARFLLRHYGSLDRLNRQNDTSYSSFSQPCPEDLPVDYEAFYRTMMAEYLRTLAGWLREDGITVPFCHNAGTPWMNGLFEESVASFRKAGEPFLLGSDHYYNLSQHWEENSPSPKYALRMLESCDTLRSLGMPPAALEFPSGSCADTPPILAEDMLAACMVNLALGLKGFNYYIFTGGPNVPGTGETADIYDFSAPVAADGTVRRDKYAVLKQIGHFARTHAWMQKTHRVASVQVGFTWNLLRAQPSGELARRMKPVRDLLKQGILYTLMCTAFAPEMVPLSGTLDPTKPLILPCPDSLDEESQLLVLDFLHLGGRVLILPDFPVKGPLASLISASVFRKETRLTPSVHVDGMAEPVYGLQGVRIASALPAGAVPVIQDTAGRILAFEMNAAGGKLLFLGASWSMTTFPQARMLETLLERLGARPVVLSRNRNIWTTLWRDETRTSVFAMNLYSGSQSTDLVLWESGKKVTRHVDLSPMEVQEIVIRP